MGNIEIIKVGIEDIPRLQDVGRQTFYETFSSNNADEDMKKYLDESFSDERLTAEINNDNSEFYFAALNDNIIGYLKLNTAQAQTEIKDDNALEIERIYVLKEFHGKNVGKVLYDKAIEVAGHKNVDYVWLGVWEENFRAIRFYEKNGFEMFDKHIFRLGNDEQTDIMMKLKLK